jgi:hypothetical protein
MDGLDCSCHVLHSAFVLNVNPTDHCAHLAFEPTPDPKEGRIKCQESLEIEVEDLFEQADLDWYVEFLKKTKWTCTRLVLSFTLPNFPRPIRHQLLYARLLQLLPLL